MNRNVLRSILAVVAGAVVGIVLSVGTDAVLQETGVFPESGRLMSNGLFVLATAYRTVYGVLGAYLTGRLAPNRPMRHVLILGALGLVANVAGLIAVWNKPPELGPMWYPIALLVLAMPTAWLGGKLWMMQSGESNLK